MMTSAELCPYCFSPLGPGHICTACSYNRSPMLGNVLLLPPGTILDGHLCIGMALGQGGFGVTYLAYDLNLQNRVAVKEFFPSGIAMRNSDLSIQAARSEDQVYYDAYLNAFYREAQHLAQLENSPNIVHVHHLFREKGTAYFVMEYVEGISLKQYLAQSGGRISPAETLRLITPVLTAASSLHRQSIIHRDIAPDNITIDHQGNIKLIDFGAAKTLSQQQSFASFAVAKNGYSAPEQYNDPDHQGPWTDIYSIGAVIYRALSGIVPQSAQIRQIKDDLIPLSQLDPSIPESVSRAVSSAMSVDIQSRFHSADEFRAALFASEPGNTAGMNSSVSFTFPTAPAQDEGYTQPIDFSPDPRRNLLIKVRKTFRQVFSPKSAASVSWKSRDSLIRILVLLVIALLALVSYLLLNAKQPGGGGWIFPQLVTVSTPTAVISQEKRVRVFYPGDYIYQNPRKREADQMIFALDGSEYEVISELSGWYQVRFVYSGVERQGYIRSDIVTLIEPVSLNDSENGTFLAH